jgi:hypothetical protein
MSEKETADVYRMQHGGAVEGPVARSERIEQFQQDQAARRGLQNLQFQELTCTLLAVIFSGATRPAATAIRQLRY